MPLRDGLPHAARRDVPPDAAQAAALPRGVRRAALRHDASPQLDALQRAGPRRDVSRLLDGLQRAALRHDASPQLDALQHELSRRDASRLLGVRQHEPSRHEASPSLAVLQRAPSQRDASRLRDVLQHAPFRHDVSLSFDVLRRAAVPSVAAAHAQLVIRVRATAPRVFAVQRRYSLRDSRARDALQRAPARWKPDAPSSNPDDLRRPISDLWQSNKWTRARHGCGRSRHASLDDFAQPKSADSATTTTPGTIDSGSRRPTSRDDTRGPSRVDSPTTNLRGTNSLGKERPTSRDVPLPLSTHTTFPTMTPDTTDHGSNRPTIPDDVREPKRVGCPTTRLPDTTGRGNSHPTIPGDDGGPSWDRVATTMLRAPIVDQYRSRPTIRDDAPAPSQAGCRTTTRHRARCDCRHRRPNLIRHTAHAPAWQC